MDENLTSSKAHRRCRVYSLSAVYICYAPPGCNKNLRGALLVYIYVMHLRGRGVMRTSGLALLVNTNKKTAIVPPRLALQGITERPEWNSSRPFLWLVQVEILEMSWLTIY